MTARTLTRAALALLVGAGLFGCSNVVDPSSGQFEGQKARQPAPQQEAQPAQPEAIAATDPAAMSPAMAQEMNRLKSENQTLKVHQAESQARIDALTKQMAQEREEQRKFREMMATNFDLLEQSVSKSLADNMERGPKPAARKDAAQKDNSKDSKTPVAGPAMMPPPSAEEPPAAAPAPKETAGPQELKPLTYWDDEKDGGAPGDSTAAKFQPRRPEAGAGQQDAQASQSSGMPPLPGMSGAEKKTAQSGGQQAPAAAPVPAPVAMATPSDKPATFHDPDLDPPAHPRELKARPEAKPLYDKGFVYFAKGDYADSIRTYEDFLKRFPDDSHSDNAQFWIGEAQLQMKQPDKAEAAYRQVLRNYAHKSTLEGYKTPDAIYKLGQISLQRGQTGRAEYYFHNVSERFGDTTAGKKAQRELESIRVNTAAGGGAAAPDPAEG